MGDGRLAPDLVGLEAQGFPARVVRCGGDFAVDEALGEPVLAGDFGHGARHALAPPVRSYIDTMDETVLVRLAEGAALDFVEEEADGLLASLRDEGEGGLRNLGQGERQVAGEVVDLVQDPHRVGELGIEEEVAPERTEGREVGQGSYSDIEHYASSTTKMLGSHTLMPERPLASSEVPVNWARSVEPSVWSPEKAMMTPGKEPPQVPLWKEVMPSVCEASTQPPTTPAVPESGACSRSATPRFIVPVAATMNL